MDSMEILNQLHYAEVHSGILVRISTYGQICITHKIHFPICSMYI